MASIDSTNYGGGIARMFLSGKFSDFELRLGGYAFKVHKIILFSKSIYFEQVCGGRFQESAQGFVELYASQCPKMAARMLQFVYFGNYTHADDDNVLQTILNNALPDDLKQAAAYNLNLRLPEYEVHGEMFRLAEYYDYDALKKFMKSKFVGNITGSSFSLSDLFGAVLAVYADDLTLDSSLRDHVIYQAQSKKQELIAMTLFQELLRSGGEFAIDFGTKCAARDRLWCSECETYTKGATGCICGFYGLCGKVKACTELDWASLRCLQCKKRGKVLPEKPVETDGGQDICSIEVEPKVKDESVLVITSKKPMKRKLAKLS